VSPSLFVAKLQLCLCLFVASKVEEIVAPSVLHLLHCADSSYTESEILLAERYVLKTIDWNLSFPNPMHFLRRISKADDYDLKSRTMGKYLLEVGTLEWRLLATPPSLVAAAAIWLSRLILGNDKWVRDACSLISIVLITLSNSSPPILPITRRMRKAP
jgi:G2/mitotic-specific cyclin 1/2